jgi:hypothetical protein
LKKAPPLGIMVPEVKNLLDWVEDMGVQDITEKDQT